MDNSKIDFQSQFPELVEMVKLLSSGYDPSISTESDPLIAQLKAMANVYDKLGYTKDKAVRELFPSTVQQRANALEIYDRHGYRGKGIQSAVGTISIKMKTRPLSSGTIILPRFTNITDANGIFNYVTTEQVSWDIIKNGWMVPKSVGVIEGRIRTLSIGGITQIGLANMDENFRIYFSEKNVAENGIFIWKENNEGYPFIQQNNVYALAESDIYDVGENAEGEKYVQFPETIVSSLGNGGYLTIKYVVSSGVKGNCKSGTLSHVADEITETVDDQKESVTEKFTITQSLPIVNGSDAERIEEMWQSYKKQQGAFDTLVTNKDYENFIQKTKNEGKEVYSNIVVASRLNDLNQTIKIKSLGNFKSKNVYTLCGDMEKLAVIVYGLSSVGDYDARFKPVTSDLELEYIKELVLNAKAITQDISLPMAAKIDEDAQTLQYGFQNQYYLQGTIILNNSVFEDEAKSIHEKVMNNLKTTLDASKVAFGEMIDYNDTIKTIIESDSRIDTVALSMPHYQIKNVSKKSESGDIEIDNLSDDRKVDLVARMILAGNVQLYEFDNTFDLDFGEVAEPQIEGIHKITTAVTHVPNKEYTLKTNEVLQLQSDKYRTTTEYSTMVNYNFRTESKYMLQMDRVLAVSSTIWTGSIIKAGSSLIVNVSDLDALTDDVARLNSDMRLSEGSILKKGTVVKSTSTINGETIEDDRTLAEDTIIEEVSTLKDGTQIADGSTLVLASDYTVEVFMTINGRSLLKEGSLICYGSVLDGQYVKMEIPTESNYKLLTGDKLDVKYIDSSGVNKTKSYGVGTIMQANFDILGITAESVTEQANSFPNTISQGQWIRIKERAVDTMEAGTPFYFVGASSFNVPAKVEDTNGSYMLKDNEYIIYTNDSHDEIVVVNPGTIVENQSDSAISVQFSEDLNIDDVTLSAVDNIGWKTIISDLDLVDQDIYSFGTGVSIAATSQTLTNEYVELDEALTVSVKDDTLSFFMTVGDVPYKARLMLNIVASNKQKLLANHSITMYDADGEEIDTVEGGENKYIAFSKPVVAIGSLATVIADTEAVSAVTLGKTTTPARSADILLITKSDLEDHDNVESDLPSKYVDLDYNFTKDSIVQFQVNVSPYVNNEGVQIEPAWFIQGLDEDGNDVELMKTNGSSLNKENGVVQSVIIDETVSFGVYIKASVNCVKIRVGQYNDSSTYNDKELDTTANVQIGKIRTLTDRKYSADEIDVFDDGTGLFNRADEFQMIKYMPNGVDVDTENSNYIKIIDKLQKYDANGQFDYGYIVQERDKVLHPTASDSYWNKHHIGNQYTIPKCDFTETGKRLLINPAQVNKRK